MHISQLWQYPVKSCRGLQQPMLPLVAGGLFGDRRWMIVGNQYQFLTQRQLPNMVKIFAVLEEGELRLRFDDQKLSVPAPSADKLIDVTVWEDQCQAMSVEASIDAVLSEWLEHPVHLVYMPETALRQVDKTYAQEGDQVSFADGFPLLLISEASLEDLNSKLESPVEMERFRPNIVVADCEPYAEDSWKTIRIGGILFDLVKPCSRCVIPSVNLYSAEKEQKVLEGLAKHRKRDNKVFFGQNVIQRNSGILYLNDTVEVVA
jgi:uncharacterized protein YcbX